MNPKGRTELNPRNSQYRDIITKPTSAISEVLHKVFPFLTPNEVTVLGSLGLAGLIMYTAKLEEANKIDAKTGKKLLSLFLALTATDALDGALARYLQSKGIEYSGKEIGPEVDSSFDRIQEAFSAWLAIYRAAHQKDKLWLVTATLTAFSNPLSSLFRAYAEKNGIIVPESGKNPFEFLGTRGGRFIGSTTRFLPSIPVGPVSVQAVVDGLTAAATLKTTASRANTVIRAKRDGVEKQSMADEKTIISAQRRFKLLAALTVLTTSITGIVLYKSLHQKS